MMILDPRVGLIAAGAAIVGSERARRTVGRGAGYAAAGIMKVGAPVVSAGQEIFEEAREVAAPRGGGGRKRTRSAAQR